MGELDDTEHNKGQTMAALSDNILLERLSAGDNTSFDDLFRDYYDRVYGLLFRLMAPQFWLRMSLTLTRASVGAT